MLFTKIILSPITTNVAYCELEEPFTKHKITPKSIYISRHEESSFHQYSEGFAIIELENEHNATVAWDAVHNGEIQFSGQKFSATQFNDDYSPVEKLTDQCLQRIFSLLPVGKRMDVERVCKRWKKVALQCSYSGTVLDIRYFSTFEDAKECIIKYGPTLKDVYYNINSPVVLLARYCDNLENLTIDYQNGRFHDGRDVQRRLTWHQFKCLSRVTLKNIQDSHCDFLQYLPDTVMELQLLNLSDCPLIHRQRYKTLVDLSHLPDLQSLELIGFQFTDGLLVGLGELNNLTHLFIENCQLSQKRKEDLSFIETLEYLTVRQLLPDNKDNWHDVFESSENLRYVEISHMRENPFWDGVSSKALRHLKYLRVNNVQWHNFHEIIEYGLPQLEYLDCQQSKNISDNELCKIVTALPNLKYVYAQGCGLTSNIVDRIKSIKANQTKSVVLKLFVGDGKGSKHNISNYDSKYFVVDTVPLAEDEMPDVNRGWFTKDCETIRKTSTVLPILDDSSPIEALPTECLCVIFSLLSLDDRLNVEEVCQRWNSLILTIWQKQKKFDVRDLRYPEDAKKCVERCGEKLEEIHYYKDHELSVIAKYCSSVKKVTIDFQDRMYDCPKPRRGKIDIHDLKSTLVQLKNLTHLSLFKVDKAYNFDFLEDLPETMIELHIFPEYELTAADVDVGKFSCLRALSLSRFQYQADFAYVPIRGIEKLENLHYLRLESWCISSYSCNPLRNLANLEYLSLQNTTGFADRDVVSVLESNKNLKYLNLSGFSNLTNPVLNAISNLHNLKTLCLNYGDDDDDDNVDHDYAGNGEHLDQLRGMSNLEYFDYGMSTMIKEDALINMISSSPNLKIMTIESDEYKTQRIIAAASKAVSHRTGDDPHLIVALGDEVNSLGKNNEYSSHVLTCEELGTEEAIVFEIEWNEWYIANDEYVKSLQTRMIMDCCMRMIMNF